MDNKDVVIDVKAKEIIKDDGNEIIVEYSEENSGYIDNVGLKKYFNKNKNTILKKMKNIQYI